MKDKLVNKNISELLTFTGEEFPTKSLYILELPIFNIENGFPFMREFCGFDGVYQDAAEAEEGARADIFASAESVKSAGASQKRVKLVETAQNLDCDILGLKFNIEKIEDISPAVAILKELLPHITKPLMIRGTNDDDLDKILLPELAKNTDRECIISSACENTYKKIIPYTADKHFIVLRSPIDINLAKEINILSSEIGQPLDKILIDTDIGGLGCGFEYGYSIIEKIKLESKTDKYLNMPIISFAAEEALKTKETKSENLSQSWGNLKDRIVMFETAAASAIKAAGANLIVINHPETLKTMKGL